MDLYQRLALSCYKEIAEINKEHRVFLVQHRETHKIYIKKYLTIFNLRIYEQLYRHPVQGIPRIVEYIQDKDQLILIEEYVPGITLSEKITNHSLSRQDIINYMIDLCEILQTLHSNTPPIIHRDIKPSNIIITNYDRVILLDFNASKQFSTGSGRDTQIFGTIGYAAPEQYGFDSSSPRTDIFSMGMLLKAMNESLSSPSEDFLSVINKCTKMSPSERYSDISTLKAELFALNSSDQKKSVSKDHFLTLPPGFRTGTLWNILFSSMICAAMIQLCLTIRFRNASVLSLWIQCILTLLLMFSMVFCIFNYLDIENPVIPYQKKFSFLFVLEITLLIEILVMVLLMIMTFMINSI